MNDQRERTIHGGGRWNKYRPRPHESAVVDKPSRQYRQGDVLLQQVSGVPDHARHALVPGGQTVLALGELTGHAHVLSVEGELAESETADTRFVTLGVEGVLTHEEHASIVVPPGTYEVVRQREYRPRPQPSSPPRSAWVVE